MVKLIVREQLWNSDPCCHNAEGGQGFVLREHWCHAWCEVVHRLSFQESDLLISLNRQLWCFASQNSCFPFILNSHYKSHLNDSWFTTEVTKCHHWWFDNHSATRKYEIILVHCKNNCLLRLLLVVTISEYCNGLPWESFRWKWFMLFQVHPLLKLS